MYRYLLFLIPLSILVTGCGSGEVATEPLPELVSTSDITETPESLNESPTPKKTPQELTETASPTSPPTDTAIPTDPEPTQVNPFSIDQLAPGQEKAFSFQSSSGEEIQYWIYLPDQYDESQKWPLLIAFHGFLGFEPSLEKVRDQYPPAWIAGDIEIPFIVIAPKASSGSWENYYQSMEELIAALNEHLSIDPDAHFLNGLSTGAVGAWNWVLTFPDRFDGISTIAGGLSMNPNDPLPENLCALKDLPIWIVHSEGDTRVPVDEIKNLVSALEDCGNTAVQFNIYQDLGHIDSISKAYKNPDLYNWMLSILE